MLSRERESLVHEVDICLVLIPRKCEKKRTRETEKERDYREKRETDNMMDGIGIDLWSVAYMKC